MTHRSESAGREPVASSVKCLMLALAGTLVITSIAAAQGFEESKPRAKFLNLRFDEDFSYLDEPAGSYVPDRSDVLKNIHLDDDWRLDLGGEFRVRIEGRTNPRFGLLRRSQNTQQFYRWMLHADVKYRNVFRVFVQGIVAHAEDQDAGFNPLHENHGDLQQLFFDIHFLGEDQPWYLRVGRQELQYGAQRLVSPLEWASTRRRFDAVKLVYDGNPWHIEGFYAKPVVIKRRQGDDFNEDFDFGGIYATYSGIPDHGLDIYAFAVDRTQDTVNPNGRIGDQSIFTLGSRFWGRTGGFDYEAELSGQWGKWAGDTVQAWSWTLDGGYTFENISCKPRIGVGVDWASGDENSTDRKVGTFSQLFPFSHFYLGFLDLVARQNITAANVNVSAWVVPDKVKTKLTFHSFWLNADEDALYNAGGRRTLRDPRGRSGVEVGNELDVTVNWKVNNHSSVLLGYSHFWDDNFVHATAGRDDDPDFYYVQYQYKF